MMMTKKFVKAANGLLIASIVGGYVVGKFAPRVGGTIALTGHLLACATAVAGAVCACKKI